MKYVFIAREGDQETVKSFYKDLENHSNEKLLEQYNREVDIGIVGVHAQALKLLALRKIFLERFGESPIIFKDNMVISLTGKRSSLSSY